MRVDLKKKKKYTSRERENADQLWYFTETRFRSKVLVSWLPDIAGFFFSLARLIEKFRILISAPWRVQKFREVRYGPLEKWWGGGGIFSSHEFFFLAHFLCRNFFFRWTSLFLNNRKSHKILTTELQVSFCTRQSAEIRILNCHMKLN